MPAAKNPLSGIECPLFWPVGLSLSLESGAFDLPWKCLAYFEGLVKTGFADPPDVWATPNKISHTSRSFILRDFSDSHAKNEIPVIVLPPYAGHTSVIADFLTRQSLIETLLQNGLSRVFCIDWRPATEETKNDDIDTSLAELHSAVSFVGGRAHLIGLCQGGWLAAVYAARYPAHAASIVCAGAPIDTQAGNGIVRDLANTLPMSFYESLVKAGNGFLRYDFIQEGLKCMYPEDHLMNKFLSLYEYIDDPDYAKRAEKFEAWYKNIVDLPGKWYLQVVEQLFKNNLFAKGAFTALGKVVGAKDVSCPAYLLAAADDDIAPPDQVFNAADLFGSPPEKIVKDLAQGGHIGLFLGTRALRERWPKVAAWLRNQKS